MELIDKTALVAEIESLRRTSFTNFDEGVNAAVQTLLEALDTLEVKEAEEEPVSNDLEEAAHLYVDTTIEYFDSEGNPCCYSAFKAGAQWQKEQLIENAVEAVIHPYDGEIWVDKDLLSIYDDCQRVKLIIIKEK